MLSKLSVVLLSSLLLLAALLSSVLPALASDTGKKFPTGDGAAYTYEWFQFPLLPATRYDKIDEDPHDSGTTTIATSDDLTARVSRFTKAAIGISDTAIISNVFLNATARLVYDANPRTPAFYLGFYNTSSATDSLSAGITVTSSSYLMYSKNWSKNPFTSQTWTEAQVDALQLSIKGISIRVRVGGVWWWTSLMVTQYFFTVVYAEPSKEWHEVAKWNFDLLTREWQGVANWKFDLITRGTNHTTRVYADHADGWIENITTQAAGWSSGWDFQNGTVWDIALYLDIGMRLSIQTLYTKRGFFFFDTAFLGSGDARILSANLSLYLDTKDKNLNQPWYNLTIQDGQPSYPTKPLVSTDYDRDLYSGDGGSINMSGVSINTRFNIPLNTAGKSWINLTGWTKFCTRISYDIDGDWDMKGYEDMSVWSSEWGHYYPTQVPYLDIIWTGFDWIESASWDFDLLTRQWTEAALWTFDLVTRSWSETSKWIFNLMTGNWAEVARWLFDLLPEELVSRAFPIEWIILPLFLCCLIGFLFIASVKRRLGQLSQEEEDQDNV